MVGAINRNMGCIEIILFLVSFESFPRLIETWDVLKLITCSMCARTVTINRNMGCIEMRVAFRLCDRLNRLIETWDVLK